MPREPHAPTEQTRAEVAALASFGVPQEAIGEYIGVSHPTLRKHYGDELRTASIKANAQVGRFLFRAASGQALKSGDGATFADCTRAAMFWAKTRMGWSDKTDVTLSGPDGGPVQIEDNGAHAKLAAILARLSPEGDAGRGTGEADR